jgi:two-component system, OmpR family, sensor histidine kinase VicK
MTLALRTQDGPQSTAALVAAASGASVAALGGLVVAGWLTVAVALIQVLPGLPPMQYNTALGFMICGAALLSAVLDLRRPTALLGGLSAAMGIATLCEYLLHADLGVDDLLVETYVLTGVTNPGRMAPNSALALTLVGAALVGLSCRSIARSRHVYPAVLGTIVIALGTAALVGYAAGVPGAYGWGSLNRMAVHTALGFILLGGGTVGLAWNAAQGESSDPPAWLPSLAVVAVGTVTICMWYALSGGPASRSPTPGQPTGDPALPNVTLVAGLLGALLLGWCLRLEQTSRRRARSLAASNQALNQQSRAREQAEERLHQLAAIVESSNDAIVATTLDGTILTWNYGAERLYGYTQDEVRGRHISLLHGQRQSGVIELFEQVMQGGRIEQLEVVNVTKDGRRIDVALTVSPVLDRGGSVIGTSSIARDITERKQLEQMKDDFVGTVSHELRTPLTAIKGFIELVADGDVGPLTDSQQEFLQIASRNTDRLGNLINDLLDVNRIEAEKLEIRDEPTDLNAVLGDVAGTFRAMAQAKGLAFQEEIDLLPLIMGDGPRLVQVFSNLVSNAIKYTPAGGIGIRARTNANHINVEVYDSGIGLSSAEQAQLFTKFYRGQNAVVAESGGTGLGLVIAKAIVEKHHGTIRVESRPDRGTCFRVTLPVDPWVPSRQPGQAG